MAGEKAKEKDVYNHYRQGMPASWTFLSTEDGGVTHGRKLKLDFSDEDGFLRAKRFSFEDISDLTSPATTVGRNDYETL